MPDAERGERRRCPANSYRQRLTPGQQLSESRAKVGTQMRIGKPPIEPQHGTRSAGMDRMSSPAAQTQWYLARDSQQFGPLSDTELAKFIELGHLQPTDLLWREGFPDWRPAMVVFPPRKPAMQRPAASARSPLISS